MRSASDIDSSVVIISASMVVSFAKTITPHREEEIGANHAI
jgi:hypothetical protein